jgi:hypothetical protein
MVVVSPVTWIVSRAAGGSVDCANAGGVAAAMPASTGANSLSQWRRFRFFKLTPWVQT